MEVTPHLVLRVLSEAGDPPAWDEAPECALRQRQLHCVRADVQGVPVPACQTPDRLSSATLEQQEVSLAWLSREVCLSDHPEL